MANTREDQGDLIKNGKAIIFNHLKIAILFSTIYIFYCTKKNLQHQHLTFEQCLSQEKKQASKKARGRTCSKTKLKVHSKPNIKKMQHRVLSWEQADTIIELWSSHLPAGPTGAVAVLNLWHHGTLESGSRLYFHKQAEDDKQ